MRPAEFGDVTSCPHYADSVPKIGLEIDVGRWRDERHDLALLVHECVLRGSWTSRHNGPKHAHRIKWPTSSTNRAGPGNPAAELTPVARVGGVQNTAT